PRFPRGLQCRSLSKALTHASPAASPVTCLQGRPAYNVERSDLGPRSFCSFREAHGVSAQGKDHSTIKATNITWHEGHVTRVEREGLLKQRGATLWFTGLSGSGKSTIAFTLEHALVQRGHLAYVLDGDNIRHGLNKNLGFSAADREENIRRIGEVAKL